jgi:phosphinothricin acetyltransferase
MSGPTIRAGRIEDLPDLVEIINYYIRETHITFDTEPFTTETRRPWFDLFADEGPHRLLVAEEEGAILGYATSTRHRPKPAYGRSVETTIYLDHDCLGRGIGTRLYSELLDQMRAESLVHRGFAGVGLPNDGSVALHEHLGFTQLGIFHEVGFKFGKYWDTCWYEIDLSGRE